jgi:hypothetical protein
MSGVTIDELADLARVRRNALAEIFEEEVRKGRVRRDDDDRYAIVLERFPRESIEAVRRLRPPEVEDCSRFARSTDGRRRVRLVSGSFRAHERAALEAPLWNARRRRSDRPSGSLGSPRRAPLHPQWEGAARARRRTGTRARASVG